MAKAKGPFKVTGTLGDYNYYEDKETRDTIIRQKGGGFDGETIKKSPRMEKVRENSSEFGSSSQVKGAFSQAIRPLLRDIRGREIHSGLMRLFMGIKSCDSVSPRGARHIYRGLQTEKGRQLLLTYCYPEYYSLPYVLQQPFAVDMDAFNFSCASLDSRMIDYPKYATHLGLTFGVVALDFSPVSARAYWAEDFFLAKDSPPVSMSLAPTGLPEASDAYLAVMGVRFYQEINGVYSPLEIGRGHSVIGVSVEV